MKGEIICTERPQLSNLNTYTHGGLITVSADLIARFLHLPESWIIQSIRWDNDSQTLLIEVRSPELPAYVVGTNPPPVVLTYQAIQYPRLTGWEVLGS